MATFEVLDELMEITGSIELHKRMRFWFCNRLPKKKNVGVAVDSLESLKQTHARETAKLAALIDAIAESLAGIHEKELHVFDQAPDAEDAIRVVMAMILMGTEKGWWNLRKVAAITHLLQIVIIVTSVVKVDMVEEHQNDLITEVMTSTNVEELTHGLEYESRLEWATWSGKKTDKKTDDVAEGDNGFKLYDVIDSDDEILSGDYDSGDSQMSHDSRKKHPDGDGLIHWFSGMKAFVTPIKTKGLRRPKLHRDLAELLDEELCR
ncbi:hypothetical protein Tco_0157162 [Tanacetum coccineum]